MTWAPTVAIALFAALIFATIARRCGLSPLLGYLVAGVAIGPHTPGFVGDVALAGQLADVGVVLLMFGVGLGFSFADLWNVRRLAVPGALAASGGVVVLGTLLGLSLGWPFGGAAVLGMCLATASTVVIVKGLTELGLLESAPGRIAVGWSLVEDLVTVVLLVVLPTLAPSHSTVGAAAATSSPVWQALLWSLVKVVLLAAIVVWGGGLVVPRLLALVARARSRELFTLAVLTLAIGVAFFASEVFGVSIALGAFFAGMVVGRSDLAHQAAADALPMRDAFAVLFFVAVGMLFDPAFVVRQPATVLAALACVLVAKPLFAFLFLLRRGQSERTALSVAAGVAQISEFSFVLAGLATASGILPEGGRDLVLAAALTSIAASPVLFRGVRPLERWLSASGIAARLGARGRTEPEPPTTGDAPEDHVVLCGYGRVGSVVGDILTSRSVPFVVVEIDRATVELLRARGVTALYGDAGNPLLLDRAGVARARALVLTMPDPITERLTTSYARTVRPDIEVVVRVHSDAHLRDAQSRPRTQAVHGERELAFAMARKVLESLGASTIEAEATVLAAARADARGDPAPRLFELAVAPESAVVGRSLADLGLPATVLVVAVVRAGGHLVPRGPTRIEGHDRLLLFATGDDAHAVERLIEGTP